MEEGGSVVDILEERSEVVLDARWVSNIEVVRYQCGPHLCVFRVRERLTFDGDSGLRAPFHRLVLRKVTHVK